MRRLALLVVASFVLTSCAASSPDGIEVSESPHVDGSSLVVECDSMEAGDGAGFVWPDGLEAGTSMEPTCASAGTDAATGDWVSAFWFVSDDADADAVVAELEELTAVAGFVSAEPTFSLCEGCSTIDGVSTFTGPQGDELAFGYSTRLDLFWTLEWSASAEEPLLGFVVFSYYTRP